MQAQYSVHRAQFNRPATISPVGCKEDQRSDDVELHVICQIPTPTHALVTNNQNQPSQKDFEE